MDFLLQQTKNFLSTNEMTRFHLGCGVNFLKGWLNINYWSHLEQVLTVVNERGNLASTF